MPPCRLNGLTWLEPGRGLLPLCPVSSWDSESDGYVTVAVDRHTALCKLLSLLYNEFKLFLHIYDIYTA